MSYLIEKTFGIDGIGLLSLNALLDKDYNIRNSLFGSYKITFNTLHLMSIFLFLIFINIIAALFGFIILSLSLTCSYIMSFKYYKYILHHNS